MKRIREIAITVLALMISATSVFAFVQNFNLSAFVTLRRDLQPTAYSLQPGNGSSQTDQYAYMPYGVATHTGNSSTPYQWLGGYGVYYDHTTELHLTTHRAYSSDTRKFISPDPLGIDGGVNVYAYANLNPLFFVDPLGLCADGGGHFSTYRQFVQNTVESPFNPFYWGDRIANDPVGGPVAFAAPALSPVSSIAGGISDISPAVINTIGSVAGRVAAGGTALVDAGRRIAYRIAEWQPFNGLVNSTSIQGGVNNVQIITTPSASTTMFGDMIYNATPYMESFLSGVSQAPPILPSSLGSAASDLAGQATYNVFNQ